jgi:cell division protein ZapA
MKNKVEVMICGNKYTVTAQESRDYILRVAEYVDGCMREMITQNPSLSTTMTAVLTAINICDEYFKVKNGTDNMRSQLQKYIDDASAARAEVRDAQLEIMRLRSEIKELKGKNPESKERQAGQLSL